MAIMVCEISFYVDHDQWNPISTFSHEKMFKVRYPISTFLFSIIGEALTYIIRKAHQNSLVEGLKIGRDTIEITHLQFADDTLIFLPHNTEQLLNLKRLLHCLSLMTGFKINFSKSSLVFWGVHFSWVENMSNILSCKIEKLPITYLGMPLGLSCKNRRFWKPILDKIEHRLTIWKSRLLSRDVKAQLIESFLNNLPSYCLSNFNLQIVQQIDRFYSKEIFLGRY